MSELSNIEMWAYVAGIVDGEGTLCFRCTSKRQTHPLARVSISNTSLELLTRIKSFLATCKIDGRIYRQPCRGNRRQSWLLQVQKRDDIYDLCVALKPYLIVKHRQCNLILEFIHLRRCEGDKGTAFRDRELELYKIVKMLNNPNRR